MKNDFLQFLEDLGIGALDYADYLVNHKYAPKETLSSKELNADFDKVLKSLAEG